MQSFFYPPGLAGNTAAAVSGSATAANQAIEIALLTDIDAKVTSIDNKTPTVGQKTMANSSPVVIASDQSAIPVTMASPPAGGATAANQVLEIAALNSIDGKTIHVDTGAVTVVASVLPTGASTAANQTTGNASVASIDSKTPALGQTTMAGSSPVVIASNQTAIPVTVASVPLPTGAATEATLATFSAKTAGALVPVAFDYQAITYVGATTDINTVTFKTGGSGGTTVATLTMGYDGSNRLTSVTKT